MLFAVKNVKVLINSIWFKIGQLLKKMKPIQFKKINKTEKIKMIYC